MNLDCVKCRGSRNLCGRNYCPIYSRLQTKVIKFDKEEFFGATPPSIFIGSKLTYPAVNVGVLSVPDFNEEVWVYNEPKYWVNQGFNINQIIKLRTNLVNSRFTSNVKDVRINDKFLELAQEIGMSKKEVDVEVKLKKKPNFKMDLDKVRLPMGPSVSLEKLKVTDNIKIENKIQKVYYDIDLKAIDAIEYLYKNNFDEYVLTQLLSIGVLGVKKDRKLVSTRSSITATDDIIGKQLIEEVKKYNTIDDYRLFYGNYLGNYYFIMMFPEIWSYELFEIYMSGSVWNPSNELKISTDDEDYYGRKKYASNCVGGYYASRLPCLEFLNNVKRQAGVLVIRFETPEYNAPLGVFVVREAARKSFENSFSFDSRENLIKKLKEIIYGRFRWNIDEVLVKSKLLKRRKEQTKLSLFCD